MHRTFMRILTASAIATTSLVAANAATINADMPCQTRSTHQAFKQWGDRGDYFLAQNGDFEQGTAGWTLNRAKRVSDQAPWKVNGNGHSKALEIRPGGSATVRMCVTEIEDVMRFFYETPAGGGGLTTKITAATTNGSGSSSWAMSTSSSGWNVTPTIRIPSVRDGDGRVWITIEISNSGIRPIIIDDVMVDPWRPR